MLLLKTVVVNAAAALLPHFKIYIHTVRYKIFKKYAIWASYGLDCLCLLFASCHLEHFILENSQFFSLVFCQNNKQKINHFPK